MNILATAVPALVWPFPQNREQRLRAQRLADLGVLKVLEDEDLRPDRLAVIMSHLLAKPTRPTVKINLDGAVNTATLIEKAIKRKQSKNSGLVE
jgi:predicted glycosyltransferase